MLAKGRGGGQVRAVTVFNWGICLVRCIIRYTRDEHGKDAGPHLLLKMKLYPKIKQTVKKRKYTTCVAYDRPSLTHSFF